jgi:hypothetical protein
LAILIDVALNEIVPQSAVEFLSYLEIDKDFA